MLDGNGLVLLVLMVNDGVARSVNRKSRLGSKFEQQSVFVQNAIKTFPL